jgi:NAD(P)-dependent dehydrogenase (short-subunit alcohol dehydrogenase family)
VNAVAPGLVMTPLTEKIAQDAEPHGMMVGRTLLGRVGEPMTTLPGRWCFWRRRWRPTSPA